MVSSLSSRSNVFISYSHQDARYLKQLQTHLAYYERVGLIEVWDDTKLTLGAVWKDEIKDALRRTKVAVLLVSAAFLGSKFIIENELPPLLAAAQSEGAVILSVILSACAFEDTQLAQFQAVNSPSKPLLSMSRSDKEKTWHLVAKTVKEAINSQPSVQVPRPEPANHPSKSNFEDFVLLRTLQGHTGFVWEVAISPDGQILASKGNENTVKIWNLLTGQLLHTITEDFGGSNPLTISPDGQILAGGKLWQLSTGKSLSTVSLSMWMAVSVAFSPDGQLLTVKYWEDDIIVWHLPTNQKLRSLSGYASRDYNIEISPDGQTLARGNEDGSISVWNWQSGNLLHTLKGNSKVQYQIDEKMDGRKLAVYYLRFSPDGQTLASRNEDGSITVWNQTTGKLLSTFFPSNAMSGLGFSSNGETLFAKGYKAMVAWHLPSEHLIGSLTGYPDNFSEAISSDGQYIALGNKNGTITIWKKK